MMKTSKMMLSMTLALGISGMARATDQVLRVAIFPFESEVKQDSSQVKDFVTRALSEVVTKEKAPAVLSLGDKITEVLTANMTGNPGIELVERAKIDKVFDELALGKTGLVDEEAAARIGHMVGAQVLVTGRAFPLDDELFIVGKVIGGSIDPRICRQNERPVKRETLADGQRTFRRDIQDFCSRTIPNWWAKT